VLAVWGAHLVGSRIAKDEPVVRRWGWSSLVSQAGLLLGLLVVIGHVIPSLDRGFRSLAIATVALNQVIGPILLKFALDRTGESGRGLAEQSFHGSELEGVAAAIKPT
jgi:ascorbate-specific PTS system EIIC-type component UlaA